MPFPARNEPDDLVGAMAGMAVGEHQPMIRPNTGTVGHKYPVLTNTYQVKPPEIICYHYDVRITPDKTPPRLNRKVWEHLDKVMGVFKGIAIAYDGRSMAYSPKKLPADEGQFSITLPDEDGGGRNGSGSARDFSVKIRFTRPIDLARLGVFVRGELRGQADEPDPSEVQSAIQAVNILIQHGPSMLYPSKSASFFLPPANPQAASLSKGLTMWRGYTTSLRMGPSKLFLNLDIASQPMVQMGSLPDVVLNYLKGTNRNLTFAQLSARNIPPAEYIKLGRFLKGLKVKLVVKDADGYQPTRKIRGIEKFSANDPATQFEADGKTHTIESYFASVYNVRLQRPDFPVVLVSKTARWPLELCYVEMGQKWTRKLDPEQTADAIRLTTVGPSDRLNMLSQGLKRIQPSDTALGQWGVEINPNPIQAMARELPQPQINYKRTVMPRNGVWDVRGQQLYNATTIERWLIVVFDSSQYFTLNDAQSAIMGLVHECENMGIRVYDKQPDIHYAPRGADTHAFIKELGMKMFEREGKPPQLVIAFLSRKPCDQYADIKRFGDQQVGVATQCLFENKVKRANPQYWQNVVLKINVKMQGGINSILKPADLGPVGERPTVLGADVSHASPGSLAPSVAALVGSLDATCSIYGSAITIQPSRLEVVACMNEMVIKLLKQFEDKHGLLPERLIMLRDGISEGQFPQVIATEVAAIRLACEHFGAEYKPALTFITCGKRHKISLFPKERVNADAKTGNVRSGTTVDTEIISPFTFDWYTQSHASLLGTGRSSHYTVLLDDSGFSADQLQQLVFNLCFTYARATRAVSVATPAFYASRLCTRAQLLLKREDDDTTTVLSSTSGSSEERLRQNALAEYRSRLKKVHVNHAESLFYM